MDIDETEEEQKDSTRQKKNTTYKVTWTSYKPTSMGEDGDHNHQKHRVQE